MSSFSVPVSPFSFPPAYIGVGYGIPSPGAQPIPTDPTKEYVAGGYGFLARGMPQVLPWMVDDLTRDFGPAVYDAMDTDPYAGGTFRLWKAQVLASKLEIIPAVQPGEEFRSDPERTGWSADEILAQEIADAFERSCNRCKTPVKAVLWEMLDAARQGNKLAEKLYEPGTGDDAGRLVLKDLKVKPRWSWLFVADVFLEVLGVLAFDPSEGGFVVIPRSKFWVMTWLPRDNDPRGTSLYRTPYRAWNHKQLLFPEYYKHVVQFGSPTRIGFVAPEAENGPVAELDKDGKPTGKMLTPGEAMNRSLECLHNGRTAAYPANSRVQTDWPQGEGRVFLSAFSFLNHEMVYGILGTTRGSMEAEHGSKADSGTSQDKETNPIRLGREALETSFRSDVAHDFVRLNWGEAIADRLTPHISLGEVEHHDLVQMMRGIAQLLASGGIDLSQLPGIHSMLGLPPAAPGAFSRAGEAGAGQVGGRSGEDDPGDQTDEDEPFPDTEKEIEGVDRSKGGVS